MLKRLIFRLLILTILVVGLGTARNAIVQTTISGYAKSQLQIPIAMKSVRFEPLEGTLHLHGIELPEIPLHDSTPENVSQSNESGKISLAVDSVDVAMNTEKLLKRYFHFDRIDVRGIHAKIDYRSDFDGTQMIVPREIWNNFQTRFPVWVAQNQERSQNTLLQIFVPLLSGNFNEAAREQIAQQFESPKYARELSQRWSKELQPLLQRTAEIGKRTERIHGVIKNPQRYSQDSSPQMIAAMVREVLLDAESLEKDLRNIISRKDSLKSTAQNDALILKQVLKNDYNKIRELQPPKLEPQQLVELLLSDDIHQRLTSVLAWVDSLNLLVDQGLAQNDAVAIAGKRPGSNCVFESRKKQIELLAKEIEFDGDLMIENQPIYFLGRIRNAAPPTDASNEAITLQLCLDFAPMKITTPQERDTVFDAAPFGSDMKRICYFAHTILNEPSDSGRFRQDPADLTPHLNNSSRIYVTACWKVQQGMKNEQQFLQRYYIACPGFQIPARTLGKKDDFSLTLSPGTSQFYAIVDRIGEEMQGRLRFTQYPVRLTTNLPESTQNIRPEIRNMFSQMTFGVDEIDVELAFSGTKNRPKFSIKSDFGDRIASNLEGVLVQNWNTMRQNMANELNDQTNQTLRGLGGMFNEQLDPTLNRLLAVHSQLSGGNANVSVQQIARSLLDNVLQNHVPQSSLPVPPYASQFINEIPQEHRSVPLMENIEQELKKGIQDGINQLFAPR